jgi:hypothetical protein
LAALPEAQSRDPRAHPDQQHAQLAAARPLPAAGGHRHRQHRITSALKLSVDAGGRRSSHSHASQPTALENTPE